MTLSKSPDRNTFQKESYLKRQAEKGKTPANDEDTRAMIEYYESWDLREDQREQDPDWRKGNLEWDLRTTDWMLEKARSNKSYAQNLYAAMCNNEFMKNEVWPVLKKQTWSCSWRYAGGIIADMLGKGDYIDWYCSGIRGDISEMSESLGAVETFVGEGHVTDEIRADLLKLGWIVVDQDSGS